MDRILNALKNEITRQQANVFAIAAARHDHVKALQLQMANPCQNVYSVAKVYVVTAIGMLVDRGLLSTDEFMTDILRQECPADYPSIWNQVTVEMLLCHRVPLPRHFLDIDVCNAVSFGADYLTYILRAHGTLENCSLEACYTDAAYYLLSRIVEQRTGMGMDNFLWKNLFYPTGCREVAWSHCPMGHTIGATGLYIRPEELAKLGAIYLSDGLWNGDRILSQSWVNTVLAKGYELKPQAGGLAFGKGGMRGQMLTIVPDTGLAVAYLGYGSHTFTDFIANYPAAP